MADDLLTRLEAFVRAYYKEKTQPLLLSRFGQLDKPLLEELKASYGTLMAAVIAAGPQRLAIVDDRRGRESMVPAEYAQGAELELQKQSAKETESSAKFSSLPVAVQVAFVVRAGEGEHVAVRTTRPFHYQKAMDPEFIRPGFRRIPEEYRRPGINLNKASQQDREALWEGFLAWAQKEQLDPAAFHEGSGTNALARLLAAQPPEIMNRLIIPADIADLLLRRP
ncbi:MAG: hypothetical protein ACK4JY_10865 [Brevundimonas sp.]|uniref:hypothetical protein n=1 Tax=Brevundimonas sp. TaxID=1871086 RepID=UPI00391B6B47